MKLNRSLLAAGISLLIPACALALQDSGQASTLTLSSNPIGNFGVVSVNVYRGSRLKKEIEYKYLKEVLGVNYVVNLERFNHDDQSLCRKYDLNCVEFPLMLLVGTDAFFNWGTLNKAYSFVLDKSRGGNKIYFHCLHGSDRTGTLASALTIREKACNKPGFDKKALLAETEATLRKHDFHKIYIFLHHRIKTWIVQYDENSGWLCK